MSLRSLRGGFTLAELLVVIAILAILAGILFPVISTSKRQAAIVRCASNMKQLGVAFQMYLSDWNGVYPSPGGKMGDYNCWSQSGNGGLVRYVRSRGGVGSVWCCPVLRKWEGKYAARTYCMNSFIRGVRCYNGKVAEYYDQQYITLKSLTVDPWHLYGCPDTLIEVPKKTILLFEGMPVSASWNYAEDYIYRCGDYWCVRGSRNQTNTIDPLIPWHDKRNNYLYCDGHIAAAQPDRYEGRVLPSRTVGYPWYVVKRNCPDSW